MHAQDHACIQSTMQGHCLQFGRTISSQAEWTVMASHIISQSECSFFTAQAAYSAQAAHRHQWRLLTRTSGLHSFLLSDFFEAGC